MPPEQSLSLGARQYGPNQHHPRQFLDHSSPECTAPGKQGVSGDGLVGQGKWGRAGGAGLVGQGCVGRLGRQAG